MTQATRVIHDERKGAVSVRKHGRKWWLPTYVKLDGTLKVLNKKVDRARDIDARREAVRARYVRLKAVAK